MYSFHVMHCSAGTSCRLITRGGMQGPERVTRREEWAAARRNLERSSRRLLQTLVLEALGLGAWLSGNAAGTFRNNADVAPATYGERGSSVGEGVVRSADTVAREVGDALAALVLEPARAVRRGEGWPEAARLAAGAAPGVLFRPVGAAAAAVQQVCLQTQQAVQATVPRP